MIGKIIASIGSFICERDMDKNSDYKPNYNGKWVNKGKGVEDWVWVEKPSAPCYVVVSDDYRVRLSRYPIEDAIECIECLDTREAEIVTEHLREYYNSIVQEG